MMQRTVRLYGRTLETWYAERVNGRNAVTQYEIEYREYDTAAGEIVGAGSEDFSPERLHRDVRMAWVYTWDGERRNAGGKRWFELRGTLKYRRSEARAVYGYMRTRYPDAVAVELR